MSKNLFDRTGGRERPENDRDHSCVSALKELDFPQAYFLNDEFNDKGVIYLRFGPPNERLIKLNDEGFGSLPPSNESWMYWQTGQTAQLVFHFVYDDNMSGNLWRLTPMLYHPAIWQDRSVWDPSYFRLLNGQTAGRFGLRYPGRE